MGRFYDVVTFDCYGTLVDWEGGISAAFSRKGLEHGYDVQRDAVLQLHAEIEPVVQNERFRSYRDILIETTQRMASRLGWQLPAGEARFLPDSLPSWPAFSDTNAALNRLVAAGYQVGVLSNIDDELIQGTLSQFDADFTPVITAEQVRAYKPARPHFEAARERLGSARWLHAAQSHFHDVQPACAMGIPAAWVNRKAEQPPAPAAPVQVVADMKGLADWLAWQSG